MKTCLNCGGENLQTATSCRLCASPLEAVETLLKVRADIPLGEQIPATVDISGPEPANQHAPSSTYAGHITCEFCQGVNEKNYAFCQQCGKPLRSGEQKAAQVEGPRSAEKEPASFEAEASAHANQASTNENEPFRTTSQDMKKMSLVKPAVNAPQPRPAQQAKPEDEGMLSIKCPGCGVVQVSAGVYCGSCGSALRHTAAAGSPRAPKRVAVIQLIVDGEQAGESYRLERNETLIGRAEGDAVFPHDNYMSGRHARVVEREGRYFLVDEKSRNGTFIRIDGEVELKPGDIFLIGKQVFRFNLNK